jgi:hypothetical protein
MPYYNNLIDRSIVPDTFDLEHRVIGTYIVEILQDGLFEDYNLPQHPFRKFNIYNRNRSVRLINNYFVTNYIGSEDLLIDYFRSSSIYHDWLHNLLDAYEDYAYSIGFDPEIN